MTDHPPEKRTARTKRTPGRPSLLTPDVETRIMNAIRCGAPNRVACAAAGIGERTFYRWEERAGERPGSEYASFAEKLARARQEGVTARLALVQKAAVRDWRAAAWLLERDMPEVFSLRYKIEHTVTEKPFTLSDAIARLNENRYLPDGPGPKLIEGGKA
jgi:hypothetical protein